MQSLPNLLPESSPPLGAAIPALPQVRLDRISYDRLFSAAAVELAEELDQRASLLPTEGATRETLLGRWREVARRVERLELRARGLAWQAAGYPSRLALAPVEPDAAALRELPRALSEQGELARHLRALFAQLGETPAALEKERQTLAGAAKSLRRRAQYMGRCGALSDVRSCAGCGEGRPGSGVLAVEGQTWCRARGCAVCAAYRGAAQAKAVERALRKVPLQKGFGLYHITFTLRWDPTSRESFTFDSMRERLRGARLALRSAWDPERVYGDKRELGLRRTELVKRVDPDTGELISSRRKTVSGLFVKFEISDRGNIHAHGLYYGDFVLKEEIERLLQRAYGGAGHIKIRRVATPQEFERYRSKTATDAEKRAVVKSIRELCKYVTKAPSPHDEGHIRGARRWRLDPRAAAAWEAALYQTPVSAVMGAFRGLGLDAEPSEEEGYLNERAKIEKDTTTACACCGLIGQWRWELKQSHRWVIDCERRGALAYPRSKRRDKKEIKR